MFACSGISTLIAPTSSQTRATWAPGASGASGSCATLLSLNTLTVRSADKLLATVRQIRHEWSVTEHKELWFRAEDERHEKTRLQPKLYRPARDNERKPVSELLSVENSCHDEFWRCADQLCETKPESDAEWDWYFLSQHHGVPTRLLDWSDGALVAMHFAVRNKASSPKTGATIYVLDPYWLLNFIKKSRSYKEAKRSWNQYRAKRPEEGSLRDDWDDIYLPHSKAERKELPLPAAPLLWDSPHVSRRVAAQRSRFMIFGSGAEWMSSLTSKSKSHLIGIKIPKDAMSSIRYELRDAGVTESVIFPDLDGLGREIEQKWLDRIQG